MADAEGTRTFQAGADAYDAFMGRYSIELAPAFADLVGLTQGQRVLDIGCGPGALTAELVQRVGPDLVAAVDPAPNFLQTCRDRHPGVDLRQARAEALPFDEGEFDLAAAQLVLHFVTDAETAVDEMRRVVAPGGTIAVSVWDFEGGMVMLRRFWDAASAVDPAAPDELEAMRFGRAGELSKLLTTAGLADVREERLTVRSRYVDVDELWGSLLRGIGPAGSYLVSLPDSGREELRAAYVRSLGSPTGAFELEAIARAAVGTVLGR